CLYVEHILGGLVMVKRNVFLVLILLTVVTAGAYAGTLKGKVSSMTKSGVVYVDRIAGKTFPATTVPYQIDQHGQSFEPRVLEIQTSISDSDRLGPPEALLLFYLTLPSTLS